MGVLGKQSFGLLSLVDAQYEIVTVQGSIYELYEQYKQGEYDDIVSYLRAKKKLTIDKHILSKNAFAAVYLIFDYDPQYQKYSDEAITEMLDIFDDETDMGKLYISYPMVEAIYHLTSLPDKGYNELTVDLNGFNGTKYKKLVNSVSCLKKNKLTKRELSFIVAQNYNKAKMISPLLSYEEILNHQIIKKNTENRIFVLSTFPLLIFDYNPDLAMKSLRLKLRDDLIKTGFV